MVFLFFVLIFSIISFGQGSFNQANTSVIYQIWRNYDTENLVNDFVNLRGGWDGFSNFCDQIFSNPSIVPGSSGKWYIYGYGDHKLSEPSVGDACWLIARNPDNVFGRQLFQ